MNLTDAQLAATCIGGEAGNQPYEGLVAVGCVIWNRLHLPYASDGTMVGTVLHRWAFSEFWAADVGGKYRQTEFDLAGAEQAAQADFNNYSAEPMWKDCQAAWVDAQAWALGSPLSFPPGPQFRRLTKRTVLYLNPSISSAPWAIPANEDAKIYAHTFFHDGSA